MLQNKEKINVDWQSQVSAVTKEAGFLLLLIVSSFVLLALLSFDPLDAGWRQMNSIGETHNLGGRLGSFIADLAFTFFGYGAFILALLPITSFINHFQRPSVRIGWPVICWRATGLLILVLSSCVLTVLFDDTETLPAGVGGILGATLAAPLVFNFGFIGATLLAVSGFLLGLIVYGDISWLQTLDSLGRNTLRITRAVFSKLKNAGIEKASTAESTVGTQKIVMINRPAMVPPPIVDRAKPTQEPSRLASVKAAKSLMTAEKPNKDGDKKVVIAPFEKKSKDSVAVQGSLFNSSELPSLSLMNRQQGEQSTGYSPEMLENMSGLLEQKLKDFGVKIEVVAINPGPVITRFEIQPAPGVKASKISNLAKDLARSLAMTSVRVVEVIPGKSVMGLEIPNENRAMVYLGDVIASSDYQNSNSPLIMALGHDIAGDPVTADLAKMPHLLVAGTTGSGKSVGVNSMLISMLYKSTPDDVRMIMVDPKMLELSIYEGIPHLLTPVITDMKEAANGLRWCVAEMERRYKLMSALGVRNIAGYNKKVLDAVKEGAPIKDPLWKRDENFEDVPPDLGKLPYIVVVIDEFADMIMIVGKKVEELIARIAQKARAAGIHLILATQRPSVDIITGLIKANVPTRIAFQVSSRIDSRTILDQGGAEQLLGHGDMLYLPPGTSIPIRVHGAFVDDDEVHAVVADWKSRGTPEYIELATESDVGSAGFSAGDEDGEADALFDEAVAFVTQTRKVSISSVQRKLRIGYNRAARLVETMENAGVVSSPSQNGSREVLAPPPVHS